MGKTYPCLLISRFEHVYGGRSVEGYDRMPYVCIRNIEVLTGPAAPHIVLFLLSRDSLASMIPRDSCHWQLSGFFDSSFASPFFPMSMSISTGWTLVQGRADYHFTSERTLQTPSSTILFERGCPTIVTTMPKFWRMMNEYFLSDTGEVFRLV